MRVLIRYAVEDSFTHHEPRSLDIHADDIQDVARALAAENIGFHRVISIITERAG